MTAGRVLALAAVVLARTGAAEGRDGLGPEPPPYAVTLGTDPGDQRPVPGILRFWSTPLDNGDPSPGAPAPLAFTRTFVWRALRMRANSCGSLALLISLYAPIAIVPLATSSPS